MPAYLGEQGVGAGFLPQRTEAVNIDSPFLPGLFNALLYSEAIKRTHHY